MDWRLHAFSRAGGAVGSAGFREGFEGLGPDRGHRGRTLAGQAGRAVSVGLWPVRASRHCEKCKKRNHLALFAFFTMYGRPVVATREGPGKFSTAACSRSPKCCPTGFSRSCFLLSEE